MRNALMPVTVCLILFNVALGAHAQAVKGSLSPNDPPAALTYHGLVPGLDTMTKVKAALGEPESAGKWYSYKMYYPAANRPGLFDVLHMHGDAADSPLANIEAASVPEGFATEQEIRAKLGEPEYELRMVTWKMFDYSSRGVRFALNPKGDTVGVAYLPQRTPRVPKGERALVDLSKHREGPQPAPKTAASLNGLKAGATEVDISPTGENWLKHPYTVKEHLKSRIVVFSDGKLTVAFVGADLFGVTYADDLVIREGAKALGVDYTIIGAAHNHASGDTLGVYGFFPADYVKNFQTLTIAGIKEALDHLQPVKELRAASRELPMDGIRVQGLFRNARNPGLLDPHIDTVQAIGNDGNPIATIIHFACHVESLEAGDKEVSADFPGYMCDQMKADGLGQAVFLNGAIGGMVSGDNKARTQESSKEMGLQLAAIAKDLVKTGVQPANFAFSVDRRDLQIPVTNSAFIMRYKMMKGKLIKGRLATDMTYVRLGEAQFISLPGELLPEVSFEILDKMNGYPTMLLGLANDEIGYMIPPYDFRDDYYEETVSQGPATANQVRDMALRMIADGEKTGN